MVYSASGQAPPPAIPHIGKSVTLGYCECGSAIQLQAHHSAYRRSIHGNIALAGEQKMVAICECGHAVEITILTRDVGPMAPGLRTRSNSRPEAPYGSKGRALAVLDQIRKNGAESVSYKEWSSACVASRDVSPSEKPESRFKLFRRAALSLAEWGIIKMQDGIVWRPHWRERDEDLIG